MSNFDSILIDEQTQRLLDSRILSLVNGDPAYNGCNLTNRVLYSKTGNANLRGETVKYYIPGYIRIKIQNFTEIDHQKLQAHINATIILTFNFQNIHQTIRNLILKNFVLRFNSDDPIQLLQEDSADFDHDKYPEEGTVEIEIHKILRSDMKNTLLDLFFAPVETITLELPIIAQSVEITEDDLWKQIQDINEQIKELKQQKAEVGSLNRADPNFHATHEEIQQEINHLESDVRELKKYYHITAKVNFMDLHSDDPQLNEKYKVFKCESTNQDTFGSYDLAENLLRVDYTNRININKQKQKQAESSMNDHSEVSEFCYALFILKLYKLPLVNLIMIFFPLWLLGLINLVVFFTESSLGDRIGSLASLMLAYVAFIPIIRSQLPPNPNITLVELLLYLQTVPTILCFGESVMVRNIDPDQFKFDYSQSGFFLVSLAIQLLQVVVMFVVLVFYWLMKYLVYPRKQSNKKADIAFNFREWSNRDCDQCFIRKFETGALHILAT